MSTVAPPPMSGQPRGPRMPGEYVAGPGYRQAAVTRPDVERRRWRIAFAIVVALAMIACLGFGYANWARRADMRVGSGAQGQPVRVAYGSITLTDFKVGTLFTDNRGKPVTPPPGTVLVAAFFRIEFDKKFDGRLCTTALRNGAGDELLRLGPSVDGPASNFCSPGRDGAQAGQKHEFQTTWIVPEDRAQGLSVAVFPTAKNREYVLLVPKG